MALDETQLERYARHIILKEVGGAGQRRLLDAKVLVIGAGGLGSPLVMYLAAAGVGTIGVVDDDAVSLSNLHRQVIHKTSDVGKPKTASVVSAVADINPDVTIIPHEMRLAPHNALELINAYEIVADGSDNFETRFLVNDACYFAKTPLVSAAVGPFDGQLATFRAFDQDGEGRDLPCYRCIYGAPPPPGTIAPCREAGILGAVPGVMGSLQALEVIKELLGLGDSLAGRLTLYDALGANFRTVRVPSDPLCPLCGKEPSIRDLSAHFDDTDRGDDANSGST